MQEQGIRELYLSEKLLDTCYNIRYRIYGLMDEEQSPEVLAKKGKLYMLGQTYFNNVANLQQQTERLMNHFKSVVWITYKSRFISLQNKKISDTGWGCMLRVGQMLFAELLKTHTHAQTIQKIIPILSLFNDMQKQAPLSIQKIALSAKHNYRLLPGQWYNPSQIAWIMRRLLSVKNKHLFSDFSVLVFNNGSIFFDQAIAKMCETNPILNCKCFPKEPLICVNCNKATKSIGMIALSRIGLKKCETESLNVLDCFIQSPYFKGIIGGRPKRALYLIGKQNDDYIYLDPHYVQDAAQANQNAQSGYFCDSFRKCPRNQIDPSLGICFYIRNLRQLNDFYRFGIQLSMKKPKEMFIQFADNTPSFIEPCRDQQDSDQQASQAPIDLNSKILRFGREVGQSSDEEQYLDLQEISNKVINQRLATATANH